MNLNLWYFLISQNISLDLKGPKRKYKLHYGRCTGPLFRAATRHNTNAAVTTNKNIKMSSFKSSENIQMKEGGPNRSVSDNQSSSVTLNELAMKARKILYFRISARKPTLTDINLNWVQITKTV